LKHLLDRIPHFGWPPLPRACLFRSVNRSRIFRTAASEETGPDRNQVRMIVHSDVDVVCEGLTASFEVRYVDGAAGERVAAARAKALAALLKWQAGRNDVRRF
jgi:hypothetical protein